MMVGIRKFLSNRNSLKVEETSLLSANIGLSLVLYIAQVREIPADTCIYIAGIATALVPPFEKLFIT